MTTTDARYQWLGDTIDRPRPGFTSTRDIANIWGTGRRTDYFHFHHTRVDFPFYTPSHHFRPDMSEMKETVEVVRLRE